MIPTMAKEVDLQGLTACHACDLLIEKHHILPGSKAACPRCRTPIYDPKADTVNRTLAVVITGLILYVPAISFPILTMTIFGKTSVNTLIEGVIGMYLEGFYLVSFMVLAFSIVVPFLMLFVLLIVLLQVKLHFYSKYLPGLFRFFGRLDSWDTVEVYMLAILVAVVKLVDIAKIHPGPGLYCFVGLLLANTLASTLLDKKQVWKNIEELCKRN
jgi:paraquat-inducible protein A